MWQGGHFLLFIKIFILHIRFLLGEDQSMLINRSKIKLADLQKIPEGERALFVLLGHLINELNILNKTFYLCSQFEEEPKWRTHAHITQALVFAKMLVGKLYEGWELLRTGYFESQISKSYHGKLNDEVKNSLAMLKHYFGKKNLIEAVRNSFAFHYSVKDAKFVLSRDLNEEELVMYLAANNGNTLYYFSEYVVNYALLEAIEKGNPQRALERLMDESAKVVRWFTDLASGIMVYITEEYLLESDGKLPLEEIELGTVPVAEEIRIPYFFTSNRDKQG